jgi:uncharacterized phage-associated protein
MAHSCLAIANEFMKLALIDKRQLTQMHLQKLVFLAHGWNLAILDNSLVDEQVEAWSYGPVIRALYDALKRYGSGPVKRSIRWGDDTPIDDGDDDGIAKEELTVSERRVIELTWKLYGDLEAFKLSAITHVDEGPWKKAFERGRNQIITNDAIKAYFRSLMLGQHAAA